MELRLAAWAAQVRPGVGSTRTLSSGSRLFGSAWQTILGRCGAEVTVEVTEDAAVLVADDDTVDEAVSDAVEVADEAKVVKQESHMIGQWWFTRTLATVSPQNPTSNAQSSGSSVLP